MLVIQPSSSNYNYCLYSLVFITYCDISLVIPSLRLEHARTNLLTRPQDMVMVPLSVFELDTSSFERLGWIEEGDNIQVGDLKFSMLHG